MLARNPKTGAPLRIITSDASTWRDQKTLFWSSSVVPELCQYSRWEVGVTSSSAPGVEKASIVLLLGDVEEEVKWLTSSAATDHTLIGITRQLVEKLGLEGLAALRLRNLLCIDEIPDLYPFVGAAWDGTVEDAKALVSMALRFSRSGPCVPGPARKETATTLSFQLLESIEPCPPLWFITQYYQPEKKKRAAEIRKCLQKNCDSSVIDRIVLLNEKSYRGSEPLLSHPKVQEEIVGSRLTYATVLRYIAEAVPADAIVVFANADIYLDDETWPLLWSVDLSNKCFALLRWDEATAEGGAGEPVLFGPRADSQDTWVLRAADVKARTWDWSALSFPFGQGGCDNAFAIEAFRQKFLVVNPALSLKTLHVHESGLRTYDPKDIVDKPVYLYVQPTGLHDLQPTFKIPKEDIFKTLKPVSLDRYLEGPSSAGQKRTFATMATKKLAGTDVIDAEGPNRWTPDPLQIERRKNIFQTRDGLQFTTRSILIGPTKAAREAWSSVTLSTMAASVHVKQALIAPLSETIVKSPARYVLEYLSKILMLRPFCPTGEFFATKEPKTFATLKLFRWGKEELPVMAYEETPQAWCEDAVIWPIREPFQNYVMAEQVEALRDALKAEWLSEPVVNSRIVSVAEGQWLTEQVAEQLASDIVWPTTDLSVYLEKLRGASGLIVDSTSEMALWAWVLPKGATVWEVQSEMSPSVTLLSLCAAAGLKHRLVIVPKASMPSGADRTKVVERIRADMVPSPPVLVLPTDKAGFFGHAGDSFREMVTLWARAGYVTLEPSADAKQVWLGGLGQTLLYDRPTLDWLRAAPPKELAWKRALFGNPAPLAGELSWTFWPRRPELVERLVAAGVAETPFDARAKRLVFYGRSENAVQRKNRVSSNWAPACDDYVHVDGEKPYPFTHEGYLKALAAARFGLCLAGFGNKCHREIECMAMGCVPIVAPEVDMTHYADPPEEGVHFFRAKSPEEAKALSETQEDQWAAMSAACKAWWKRNASVEGSFLLTKRLAGLL